MGTRGAYGFRLNGEDRLAYNHFDSYPDGLGSDIVKDFNEFVKSFTGDDKYQEAIGTLKQLVLSMEAVNSSALPTDAQKNFLKKYADLSVSEQSLDDWYCLLRLTQGRIIVTAQARYYESSNNFVFNSLFCEYAYIINLDTEMLEFYEGFNKQRGQGRYEDCFDEREASPHSMGYRAVTLIKEFPLASLSEATVEEMVKLTSEDEEDDE